jgi:phosphopantothenoylcysteine synthetase/decarboxylase
MSSNKLLVGISGSVGVLSMPDYLLVLKSYYQNIRAIMTQAAQSFMPKSSLALVVGDVYTDFFPSTGPYVNHIQLSNWADLVIVLPATANILAEVAHGLAGSLLTATILAHEKPVVFFPNMNDGMWNQKVVQRNVSILKDLGHIIVEPPFQDGVAIGTGKRETGRYLPLPEVVARFLEEEIKRRTEAYVQGS